MSANAQRHSKVGPREKTLPKQPKLKVNHGGLLDASQEGEVRRSFARSVEQKGLSTTTPVIEIQGSGRNFTAHIHLRDESATPNGRGTGESPIDAFSAAMANVLSRQPRVKAGKRHRQEARHTAQAARINHVDSDEANGAAKKTAAAAPSRRGYDDPGADKVEFPVSAEAFTLA